MGRINKEHGSGEAIMKCNNCNKKIKQTLVTGVWYHKRNNAVYCHNPATATPKEKRSKKK